jgi:hypothetical protein
VKVGGKRVVRLHYLGGFHAREVRKLCAEAFALDGLFDAALSDLAGWRRAQLADLGLLQAQVAAQGRRLRRLGARAVAA